MTALVEWHTEHGVYLVTPEDRSLLIDDLICFGTACVKTDDDGTSHRIDPNNIFGEAFTS